LIDMRGQQDIFWKPLEITQINTIDALSSMAVYLMGEWSACTPIVIGRNIPHLVYTTQDCYDDVSIPPEQDLYRGILSPLWK
jgi:F420-0:gamma-glutamyl ligase